MLRISAVLVALLAVAATGPAPAAAEVRPSPLPSFSPAPPSVEDAATEVQRQQRALASESAILAKAAATANAALQAHQRAQREAQEATAAAIAESVRATSAERQTRVARRQLLGYAGSLYRTGMVDSSLLILTDALASTEPQQLFGGLGLVKRVATTRSNALVALAEAEAQQAAAAQAAQAAAIRQQAATVRAARAKAAAAKVVATYTHQVMARRIALARTTSTLEQAQEREANLERAEEIARARGWRPTPDCAGRDTSGYQNGAIPPDALCPLWFTVGHRLRADAAAAFKPMALEYAAAFGSPLCVTDSYRTYGAQVTVAAEKPTLAAEPGRSNHGWGLALDLCDGIQSFGTEQHVWMADFALQFGWFQPAWAQSGGSKPEAWHWEYAG